MVVEFTKINGFTVQKNNPTYISINSRLSVPADSLTIVFRYNGEYTEYKYVKVVYDEKIIFKGVVDSQKITVNKKGEYLTVYCRSLAGCLLDNQLQPQNIQGITDSVIYNSYLKPFNISINKITNKPCSQIINIGKGISVYELLCEYSSRVFNCQPRITPQGIAVLNGNVSCVNYSFTNGVSNLDENSYYCTSVEVEYNRYGVISQVYVRNNLNDTGYCLILENKEAKQRGIECKRYLDATPLSGFCTYDGTRIIDDSNKQSINIKVICPCFVYNPVGGTAKVSSGNNVYENMEIYSANHIFSKSGVSTILKMKKKGEG